MSAIQLPDACGVMLLPDCTLFPHGGLPLNIFEPRYRKMVQDAMEGDCMFAIARRMGEETEDPAACVAPVGTIGLIRASYEQKDGTYHTLLHGVIRVEFTEWHRGREYPFATIDPRVNHFSAEGQEQAAMATLRGAVEDAIRNLPEEVRRAVMELMHRAEEPALLTDIVGQQFIHEPDIRHRILETDDVGKRISLLCAELVRLSGE